MAAQLYRGAQGRTPGRTELHPGRALGIAGTSRPQAVQTITPHPPLAVTTLVSAALRRTYPRATGCSSASPPGQFRVQLETNPGDGLRPD